MSKCKKHGCNCAKDSKILITGANGFLGSREVEKLYEDGHKNVIASDMAPEFKNRLPKGFTYVPMDITKEESIGAVLSQYRPEIIINNAAIFKFSASPALMDKANGDAPVKIAEIGEKYGLEYLLQTSSGTVYEGGRLVTEESKLGPIEPYGHSKLRSEALLHNYVKDGGKVKVANCRLAVIYGEGSKYGFMYAALVQDLFRRLLLGAGGYPMGGRDFEGCYVHVDDVISAHQHLIRNREQLFVSNPQRMADSAYNVVDSVALPHKALSEIVNNAALELMEEKGACLPKKMLRRLFTGKFVPLPKAPLIAIAEAYEKIMPQLRKIKGFPDIEIGLEKGNFLYTFGSISMSNKKLCSTGFTLGHPNSLDRKDGMGPVIKEHIRNNWEALFGPTLAKLIAFL
ncbi:MAG: NAD(P)-dependent oxidoreductase [Candidatus Woesearchaeota archaeon]